MTIYENTDVNELFQSKEIVKICAPMVRYSKLQFRNLVKKYDCDLLFTPMILSDSFCKSEKARNNEFTTNQYDTPLVVQFAANTVHDFVGAAHMVSPYCNGVDLNCGCPQSWATQQGIGCSMLQKPELIFDIVRQCRNHIPKPFSVSVKMRILKDLKKTINLCKQLEMAGSTFVTIHARTPGQLTGEINVEALRLVSENVNIPVVANGGIKTLEDCYNLQKKTKCKGIMVANGLLTNPGLFSNLNVTSEECIQNWVDICYNSTIKTDCYEQVKLEKLKPGIKEKPYNLTFQCFHHHLVFMLEKVLPKKQRHIFNSLQKFCDVLDFLENYFNIKPRLYDEDEFAKMSLSNLDYSARDELYNSLKPTEVVESNEFLYDYESSHGKYFESKLNETNANDSVDCDWSDLFLEKG